MATYIPTGLNSVTIDGSVAVLGLGCVTFGREIDRETSFKLMDHAYTRGIRLFDTAAAYGNGTSERIVGEWLAQNPAVNDSVTIATKILPSYQPGRIRTSVRASLDRLGKEGIDILYLHRWDEQLHDTKPWLELLALVDEGKVKAIGLSNFNTRQLADAVQLLKDIGKGSISYIQNNNNLAVSDLTNDMKNICKQNNIRIVTYSPLGAGFLTGKHMNEVQKGSRFAIMPAHQGVYFTEKAQRRLQRLLDIADRTGHVPELLALSWATHQDGVYSVLIGARTIEHLDLPFKALQFGDQAILDHLGNF